MMCDLSKLCPSKKPAQVRQVNMTEMTQEQLAALVKEWNDLHSQKQDRLEVHTHLPDTKKSTVDRVEHTPCRIRDQSLSPNSSQNLFSSKDTSKPLSRHNSSSKSSLFIRYQALPSVCVDSWVDSEEIEGRKERRSLYCLAQMLGSS